jgi:hypothetical protein
MAREVSRELDVANLFWHKAELRAHDRQIDIFSKSVKLQRVATEVDMLYRLGNSALPYLAYGERENHLFHCRSGSWCGLALDRPATSAESTERRTRSAQVSARD